MEGISEEHQAALKRELAVIDELLALPPVEEHETRFDNEVALVAPGVNLKEVCAVVERYLPPAVKPPHQDVPRELAASDLVDSMGGVREDQTLYVKNVGDGISLYVAFWPWGGGHRFTIKIGVHVQTA